MGQRATYNREKMSGIQFSAWAAEDDDGIQLAVFFTGFETTEEMNSFLDTLVPYWENGYIHQPPLREQ
jgi:hypothetical protein